VYDHAISKAVDYIKAHLRDDFSLEDLARHAGYSSYHFARGFKEKTGKTVMEYVREERIHAASAEIAAGRNICETAMDYNFDTHAGFTKAFCAVFGCTPKEYAAHRQKPYTGGIMIMEKSKIVIRSVCRDDVGDLWENVYSAMTPRQITETKIQPWIEKEQRGEGVHLVAEVDGKVIMALPMDKPFWLPLGFLFDNNFVSDGGDGDIIMGKLLDEMKRRCKMMGITTLVAPEYENSGSSEAFMRFGFTKAFVSGGWDYLMLQV
jgi:AraC-like DNA-binding protein